MSSRNKFNLWLKGQRLEIKLESKIVFEVKKGRNSQYQETNLFQKLKEIRD